jgi:hypothetical protein
MYTPTMQQYRLFLYQYISSVLVPIGMPTTSENKNGNFTSEIIGFI